MKQFKHLLTFILIILFTYQTEAQVVKVINNRVGIGTTSPLYKLDVRGDTYGYWYHFPGTRGIKSTTYGTYLQAINANYWGSRTDRGIRMQNRGGTIKGYVYHNNANGFGLLDGDGNWGMRMERDNYTRFSINNLIRMTINGNGRIDIPNGNDASGTANTGALQVQGKLRIDGNEMITNQNTILYLQNGNNGDLNVDGGTMLVDASTNTVKITRIIDANNASYYQDPSSISRNSWLLPVSDNAGYCGSSASTWGYGYFNRLYRTFEFTLSDQRAKENIRNIEGALSKIIALEGKLYNYKASVTEEGDYTTFQNEEENIEEVAPDIVDMTNEIEAVELNQASTDVKDLADAPDGIHEVSSTKEPALPINITPLKNERDEAELAKESNRNKSVRDSYGFLAQEVLKVVPEAVDYDKVNDIYSLSYSSLIPIIVEATKEQQDIIESQNEKINDLQEQINALKKLIEKK